MYAPPPSIKVRKMTTYNITDYDIQAYVDDELKHEKAKKVRAYIMKNSDAYKRYDQLKEQKNVLKAWWKSKQN